MPRVVLGTAYIDQVQAFGTGSIARPDLINLLPQIDEVDVPLSTPIELKIVDVGTQGLAAVTRVDITTVTAGTVAAFIQGTGFDSTYSTSVFTAAISPGGGTIDEHSLQLIRNTPFDSEEVVTVRVRAQTNDNLILDRTYSFTIEDVTLPTLADAYTRGLTNLILKFSEPVSMSTGVNGALRVREISGRVSFIAPRFIDAEKGLFNSDSVNDFIAVTGSEQTLNNSYFTISSTLTTDSVQVLEQTVATEEPLLSVQAWTGPYKITALIEPELLIPSFTPAVTAAVQEDDVTVNLTLDQELSPGRPYSITVNNIQDAADPANLQTSTTITFTAEPLPKLTNRSFSLWDNMIPDKNKRDDTTGDLQRLVRCFDEVTQLLLHDTDTFASLGDIDTAPSGALDVHLANLGNPFSFVHDDLMKRKTILNLVRIYKKSGIDQGIEEAVKFFLGLDVVVQPFHLLDGWILGESSLGVDTVLGTDVAFLLYSFEILSSVVLTQEQRDIITEIANIIKPAHTHFVRFVEP